ncbi:N-acetylmuramoyl-L-alanine amidase, partial [Amaricoccus sp.]|uniref:N-acetylmuramoyl-L-alanine amidase n=1 Tax=Amaricoccus sp. TaxID=1872485 RepID=UPI002CC0BD86
GGGAANPPPTGAAPPTPGRVAGSPPYPEPQMAALETLLDGVMARWGLGPDGVIGHSDMAPGRKADPGPKFDWRRLASEGRALWPASVAQGDRADWGRFAAAAGRVGYVEPDGGWPAVLEAVRLRFRPMACGRSLAAEDLAVLEGLGGRGGG